MHRLWTNYPELVRKIFEDTRTEGPCLEDFMDESELFGLDREDRHQWALSFKVKGLGSLTRTTSDMLFRHTMFQCALVCRLFSDHALLFLWERVPLFDPLVQLFPDDLKVEHFGQPLPIIRQSIGDSSLWKSFFKYKGLIKALAHGEDVGKTKSSTVSQIVTNYPYGSPIFPRLQHLAWDVASAEDLQMAASLLSHSLRSLDIRGLCKFDFTSTSVALLHDIGNKAPNLSQLSFTGFFVVASALDEYRHLGMRLKSLKELKLMQDPDWHAFPSLLEIRGMMPILDISQPMFLTLESLTLHGDLQYIQEVLSILRCHPRKDLHLRLSQVPNALQLASFIRRFSESAPQTLRHFEILVGNDFVFQEQVGDRVLRGSSLRPLFRFSQLEHLEFHQLGISIELSNEDIMDMNTAFPCLRFLALHSYPSHFHFPEWMPTLRLQSLVLFSTFPSLQVLKTPILAPNAIDIRELIDAVPFCHKSPLWGLNWGISNIDEELQLYVVRFLFKLFPDLRLVKRCKSEKLVAKKLVSKRGQKVYPAVVEREWEFLPVHTSPLPEKWIYRAWCL